MQTTTKYKLNLNNQIMIEKKTILGSYTVPWVVNPSDRSPEDARKFLRAGNPVDDDLNDVFADENRDYHTGKILDSEVYRVKGKQRFLKLTDHVFVQAPASSITKNCNTIILIDENSDYHNRMKVDTEIRLLTAMAVWGCAKGCYIFPRTGVRINLEFNEYRWKRIQDKLVTWAGQI